MNLETSILISFCWIFKLLCASVELFIVQMGSNLSILILNPNLVLLNLILTFKLNLNIDSKFRISSLRKLNFGQFKQSSYLCDSWDNHNNIWELIHNQMSKFYIGRAYRTVKSSNANCKNKVIYNHGNYII